MSDVKKQLDEALEAAREAIGLAKEAEAELMAKIEALSACRQQWQTIESAPKNEQILVAVEFECSGDWRIKTGYLHSEESEFQQWRVWGASWTPTHWMPLPPTPGAAHGIKGE